MTPFRIGFCGTTEHSAQCAQALFDDPRFEIIWVLTPPQKPVGRKKTLTPCALETWAKNKGLHHIAVESKLKDLQSVLTEQPVDFLVVVAFGYLLPPWMLQLPQIAPVNVHPSDLPRYRGASPGQFAVLFGERDSAVTIMTMSERFDEGDVLKSLPFAVSETETQETYYHKAFDLVKAALPHALTEYAQNPSSIPQPPKSPTVYARRLVREDGYIPYSIIEIACKGMQGLSKESVQSWNELSKDLLDQQTLIPSEILDRYMRALSPWPGVWTTLPNNNLRLKILAGEKIGDRFQISQYQIEGEQKQVGSPFPV